MSLTQEADQDGDDLHGCRACLQPYDLRRCEVGNLTVTLSIALTESTSSLLEEQEEGLSSIFSLSTTGPRAAA